MTSHRPRITTLLLLCTLTFLLLLPPYAGAPQAPAGEDAASAYLRDHPGGVRLNSNEVRYGPLIVTVMQSVAASPQCPAGWFCFYEGINYTFPQGKLSSCGWQDLTAYSWGNRVESAYYNLNNGRVTFYDRKTSSPNDDVALFAVSTAVRADTDTSPARNKADYVYRSC